MSRIALIAAGLIVATVLAVVVNLVTSGGPWWLWLVLAVLVVPAVVIEMARERGRRPAAGRTQEIDVSGGGQVTDSPLRMEIEESGSATTTEEPGSAEKQKIVVGRKGSVLRSPEVIRLIRRG